jgi:hypothetical protein
VAGEEPTQGRVIAFLHGCAARAGTSRGTWRRILAWTGATAALALVALFAINAFDEALSAEARAVLAAPPRAAIAPDKNLFVALAGFQAPAGASIVRYGSARIAEHNRIVAGDGAVQPAAQPRLDYAGDTSWCEPRTHSCWTDVSTHAGEIRAALEKNAELYRRYRTLHEYDAFVDTASPSASPSTPALAAYVPADVRALFIADIALRVHDARTFDARGEALAELDRDIATWRLMLVSARSLLPAMLASNYLHGDYALLADMVADRGVDVAAHGPRIAAMLERLRVDDWKIAIAIDSETRSTGTALARASTSDPRTVRAVFGDISFDSGVPGALAKALDCFLEPNATLNLWAEHARRVREFARVAPQALAAELEKLRQWRAENLAPGADYVYNPVGKRLVAAAAGALDAYPLRAYDSAAFHRAVGLAYEIRQRRIAPAAIPAFMRAHPQWATHPVSGETFGYDAALHALVVTPLGASRRERRFTVPVAGG